MTSNAEWPNIYLVRTTLTIDEDIAVSLERMRRTRKLSLRQAVNDLLRAGLMAEADKPEPKPFVQRTFKMGLKPGIDPLRLNQLVDELEVEEFLHR